MREKRVTHLARANSRGEQGRVFGIRAPDRRAHLYMVGKSGTGKSTLLENMVVQDLHAGEGVCLIDPHGQTAERILEYVPRNRLHEVVYFNPADLERPVGLNLLTRAPKERRHLLAGSIVSTFRHLWRDSWGPRLEYILHNSLLALLDFPEATLVDLPRLLTNERFRERVIARVEDPIVRLFWTGEFAAYSDQYRTEAIAPIQNKVGRLLTTAPLRNIIGQVHNKIDLRFMMDNRRILIANLAKGQVSEDAANLLGSLLISGLALAAIERADMKEEHRPDFYLHIDEVHNFTTDAFTTILSEARKYRLCLSLSHQYLDQLSEPMQTAIFGNVGTVVSFRVGEKDARTLARELPLFGPEDFVSLGKYGVYLKLLIDGQTSQPFSATTLPLAGRFYVGKGRAVKKTSRERFTRSREVVERRIDASLAA